MSQNVSFINVEEISHYLKDIKKIPVADKERLDVIIKGLKRKDITKLERDGLLKDLVLGNLRFVISIAKQFQNQGMDLPDIISEGNIGLIRAAEEYKPSKNVKFISYAVWWIRQSIMASLNDNSRTIRLPSNIIQDQQKQRKVNLNPYEEGYYEKLGQQGLLSLPYTVDLSQEINDEGDQLIDIIVNKDAMDPETFLNTDEERKMHVRNALSVLNEKERIIIEKYFGLCGVESNLEDLGEEFGCTKERIRQLKEKAMKKLRNESFGLLKYL